MIIHVFAAYDCEKQKDLLSIRLIVNTPSKETHIKCATIPRTNLKDTVENR